MSQTDIRNKAIRPEVLEAFMAGERTGVCPVCGSDDVDYVDHDGSLDEGWQKNTISCYECGTWWTEEFECVPVPKQLDIEELAGEREYAEDGCSSWRGQKTDEELEAIVEEIIAGM